MIKIECANCEVTFDLLFVRTIKGVMKDRHDVNICCQHCGSEDVKRVFTEANDGAPNLGKWSATNQTNRKR